MKSGESEPAGPSKSDSPMPTAYVKPANLLNLPHFSISGPFFLMLGYQLRRSGQADCGASMGVLSFDELDASHY